MDIALLPALSLPVRRPRGLLAVVVIVHLLLIGALVHVRHAQPAALQPPRVVAWLLAPEPPAAPPVPTPRASVLPVDVPRKSPVLPVQVNQTPRIDPQALATEPVPSSAPAAAQERAPSSSAQPSMAQVEPPAPPVTAPRFDLDYLNNPPPPYPAASRRAGEQGKTLLRVLVGAQGEVLQVELLQSSGFDRLDHAAREAVRAWRFLPARRGDEAVQAWAVVPLNFRLNA